MGAHDACGTKKWGEPTSIVHVTKTALAHGKKSHSKYKINPDIKICSCWDFHASQHPLSRKRDWQQWGDSEWCGSPALCETGATCPMMSRQHGHTGSLFHVCLLCWHVYKPATPAWHTAASLHLCLQRAHSTWWEDDGSARQRAPQSIRQDVRHCGPITRQPTQAERVLWLPE